MASQKPAGRGRPHWSRAGRQQPPEPRQPPGSQQPAESEPAAAGRGHWHDKGERERGRCRQGRDAAAATTAAAKPARPARPPGRARVRPDRQDRRARSAPSASCRSRRSLLSLYALGASIYLTIAHYDTHVTLACSDKGLVNCAEVTTSSQSMVFGIFPVAVLGLAFYVFMTALNSPWVWRLQQTGSEQLATVAAVHPDRRHRGRHGLRALPHLCRAHPDRRHLPVVHQRSRGHVPDLCADRLLHVVLVRDASPGSPGLNLSGRGGRDIIG